jgi:hypothetical protein
MDLQGLSSGPRALKLAPKTSQSPSKTKMDPPGASLGAPWAPPGSPKGPEGCPREHPEQDQERPKPLIFHWFLIGSANRCFSEARVTRKKERRKCCKGPNTCSQESEK